MAPDRMAAARAAALFVSDLSSYCRPSETDVAAAIRKTIAAYGGVLGCLGEVAAAYGEHPETAVPRMRWARQTIDAVYSPTALSRWQPCAAPEPMPGFDEAKGTRHVVSSIA